MRAVFPCVECAFSFAKMRRGRLHRYARPSAAHVTRSLSLFPTHTRAREALEDVVNVQQSNATFFAAKQHKPTGLKHKEKSATVRTYACIQPSILDASFSVERVYGASLSVSLERDSGLALRFPPLSLLVLRYTDTLF